GITSGITPNAAYRARMAVTLRSGLSPGYGNPVRSIRSISADRSWPVTTSLGDPLIAAGWTSYCSTTPSMSTRGSPAQGTSRMTRNSGSKSRACNGDSLVSVNVSWKPLRPVAASVTCAETNASMTGFGTGTASAGPASSVRYSGPLSIARSGRHRGGDGDNDRSARLPGELVGIGCRVGVADHPVERRIAKKLLGQVVQPVPVADDVSRRRGVHRRLRDDPAVEVLDIGSVRERE